MKKLQLFKDYKPAPPPDEVHTFGELTPRLFRFWDINHKFLIVMNKKLVASPNDSNSSEQLIAVLPNHALDVKQQPIFMGLPNGTHTISCVKSEEGQVQLQLTDRNIVRLYNQNEKFLDFSFYSRTDGGSETCSFESAQFPGWFISTSSEPDKPIGLSQKGGPGNILFYFERKS
ncbi:interleukin-1 family member 10-like isoform 1-T5 [Liasis olivaceus]